MVTRFSLPDGVQVVVWDLVGWRVGGREPRTLLVCTLVAGVVLWLVDLQASSRDLALRAKMCGPVSESLLVQSCSLRPLHLHSGGHLSRLSQARPIPSPLGL